MQQAEQLTGLTMRDLQRPASDQPPGGEAIVTPLNPEMRFQLGEVQLERISLPEIPGVREAVNATEATFTLKAYGATPEQAVARYRSRL